MSTFNPIYTSAGTYLKYWGGGQGEPGVGESGVKGAGVKKNWEKQTKGSKGEA